MRKALVLAVLVAVLITAAVLPSVASANGSPFTWDHNGLTCTLGFTFSPYNTGNYNFVQPNQWTMKIGRTDGTWVVTSVKWEIWGVGDLANSNLTGDSTGFSPAHVVSSYTQSSITYNHTYSKTNWSSTWLDTRVQYAWHWVAKCTVSAKRGGKSYSWVHGGEVTQGAQIWYPSSFPY